MVKKKILIIDDEEDFLNLLKLRLESEASYLVKTLSDSKEVISSVHLFRPDVILLDLLMPGVGGLEICQMLNNDPIGQGVPIIVLTALDKELDKTKALKLGVEGYLVKPVDDQALIAVIEKTIKLKSEDNP